MSIDLIVVIPVVALLFAGVIALEAVLAGKGKRQGLVLPLIFLGLSVLVFAGLLVIPAIQSTQANHFRIENFAYAPDGTLILPDPAPSFLGIDVNDLVRALLWFLICNAFTGILLGVYAVCRRRRSRRQGLEKMRVQDL